MQTAQPTALPSATTQAAPTAAEMLKAAKAYREVLGDQLSRLQDKRSTLSRQLRDNNIENIDRTGAETRLKDIDARILDMDKQIATADAGTAKAALVPGATYQPPDPPRPGPTDEMYILAGISLFIFGLPVSLAFARRIWRRSAKTTISLSPEMSTRMQSMEAAIESIAIEVERIGEGQRFVTQALTETNRQLGAGAAEPLRVRQRDMVGAERPL